MLIIVLKVNTIFIQIEHKDLQEVIPFLSSFLSPRKFPFIKEHLNCLSLCIYTAF